MVIRSRTLPSQPWRRDTGGPTLSLGPTGAFDDAHLFAPCVARLDDRRWWMWYCGSRDGVDHRVFRMGLAVSDDGVRFEKRDDPVLGFADARRSVLTPQLVRGDAGAVSRVNAKLMMYFAATDFPSGDGRHTLHRATSDDGVTWGEPSEPLLEGVYAPTLLHDGRELRMWYTDVRDDPWRFRHARSDDGLAWRVTPDPVLELGQAWERQRLFYPHVVRCGGRLGLWYGAYWSAMDRDGEPRTAIGFAVSDDGLCWERHSANPVLTPDPARAWESHFTTSHTVLPMRDGSWRIWYATRHAPPFVHKYFAISTARLDGAPM